VYVDEERRSCVDCVKICVCDVWSNWNLVCVDIGAVRACVGVCICICMH
jgi:hypothetical protein